jgi:hypothetical protein
VVRAPFCLLKLFLSGLARNLLVQAAQTAAWFCLSFSFETYVILARDLKNRQRRKSAILNAAYGALDI